MNSHITGLPRNYNNKFTDYQLYIFIRNNTSSPEVLDQHLGEIIKRLTTNLENTEFNSSGNLFQYKLMNQLISLRGFRIIGLHSKFDFHDFANHLQLYIERMPNVDVFKNWEQITVNLTIMSQNFQHPLDLLGCLETHGLLKDSFYCFIFHLLELLKYKGPYIRPIIDILFNVFKRNEFDIKYLLNFITEVDNKNNDLLNNFLLLFSKLSKTDKFNTKIYLFIKTNMILQPLTICIDTLIKYYKNVFKFVCGTFPEDENKIIKFMLDTLETGDLFNSYKASKTLIGLSCFATDKDIIGKYMHSYLDTKKIVNIRFLFVVAECYRKNIPVFYNKCKREELLLDILLNCSKEELLETRKGRLSVEKYGIKRDCTFFSLWSIFHFSDKEQLQRINRAKGIKNIIGSIIYSSLFDNDIKLRRAASATFQEIVGKLTDNSKLVEVLNLLDFHGVANRNKCRDNTLQQVVKLDPFYFECLSDNFVKYKQSFILQKDRDHFSKYIGRLFEIESENNGKEIHFINNYKTALFKILKNKRYLDEKELLKLITYLNGIKLAYQIIDAKKENNDYVLLLKELMEEICDIITTTLISKLKQKSGFKRDFIKSILEIVSLNHKSNTTEAKTNIKWIEDLLNIGDTNLTKYIIETIMSFFHNTQLNPSLFESFTKCLDCKIKSLERINSTKLAILYELLTNLLLNFHFSDSAMSNYFLKFVTILRDSENIKLRKDLTRVFITSNDINSSYLKEEYIAELVKVLNLNCNVYITQFGKDASGDLRVESLKLALLLTQNCSDLLGVKLLKELHFFVLYHYKRMENEPYTNVCNKLSDLDFNIIGINKNIENKEFKEVENKGILEGLIKTLSIEDYDLTNQHKILLSTVFSILKEGEIIKLFQINRKYKLGIISVIYYVLSHSSIKINTGKFIFYFKGLLSQIKNKKLIIIINRRVCKFLNECKEFKKLICADYKDWVDLVDSPVLKKEFNDLIKS